MDPFASVDEECGGISESQEELLLHSDFISHLSITDHIFPFSPADDDGDGSVPSYWITGSSGIVTRPNSPFYDCYDTPPNNGLRQQEDSGLRQGLPDAVIVPTEITSSTGDNNLLNNDVSRQEDPGLGHGHPIEEIVPINIPSSPEEESGLGSVHREEDIVPSEIPSSPNDITCLNNAYSELGSGHPEDEVMRGFETSTGIPPEDGNLDHSAEDVEMGSSRTNDFGACKRNLLLGESSTAKRPCVLGTSGPASEDVRRVRVLPPSFRNSWYATDVGTGIVDSATRDPNPSSGTCNRYLPHGEDSAVNNSCDMGTSEPASEGVRRVRVLPPSIQNPVNGTDVGPGIADSIARASNPSVSAPHNVLETDRDSYFPACLLDFVEAFSTNPTPTIQNSYLQEIAAKGMRSSPSWWFRQGKRSGSTRNQSKNR